MRIKVGIIVLAMLCFVPYAHAQWNVTTSTGSVYTTDAMAGFATTGAMMDGMQVTATFSNGSSETKTWGTIGPVVNGSGGATGTGWSLLLTGDTFSAPWNLTNTSGKLMTHLIIAAAPGNTVFDIVPSPEDTPGSASGLPFTYSSGLPGSGTAAYADILEVGTPLPVFYGDLYETLALSFGGDGLPSNANNIFVFNADTDNAASNSPIRPAPEPLSILLLSAGILGIAAFRRRIQ